MTAGDDALPPSGGRVLVAEDERHLGLLLEHFLAARGHDVTLVHDGRAALDALSSAPYDVALLDVQMPELDGLAVLRATRALPLPPQVIVMTGNGTIDTAIAAMQDGAYDYVAKPYRMAEVELLVRRAHERRRLERAAVAAESLGTADAPLTRYAPLRAVLDLVERAAPALGGMLVCGEPGTGRTRLARHVHRVAGGGPFVVLDGRDAAEAPVVARRVAAARSGTLYLPAVDALPRGAQRAVADASGADGAPRIVAASARTPGAVALDGALRAALGALVVELPPLRERAGDVAALAESFAREFGGASPPAITVAAAERLERHAWPGNVAELRLVMEGAVARAVRGAIAPEQLNLDPVVTLQ